MVLQSLHRRGFFHLLSANFLTQFLGFGTMLLVAKFLRPSELGDIKILQSWATLFTIAAGFGLNTAVLKFCAENRPEAERVDIVRRALRMAGWTTLACLTVVGALAGAGVLVSSKRLAAWLVVYSAVIPFGVVTAILIVYLQALQRIRAMARAQIVIKLQSFVLIAATTWYWGFAGFITATIVAYAAGLVPLVREAGRGILRPAGGTTLPATFVHVAWFSMLANGVSTLGQNADMYLLDRLVTDRAGIGYYALATILVFAASQVTATMQTIVTPEFSQRAQDETWVRRQLVRVQWRMVGLSILVAAAVWVAASVLVPAVYGPMYRPTLGYLALLLLRFVLWSSYAIVGAVLVALGLMRYNFLVVAVSTPIGLALTYFLIRHFGITGAAWGQIATQVVNLVLVLAGLPLVLRQAYPRRTTPPEVAGGVASELQAN
ncbi:MAG TPA: oligosaccharide flippase family protein [Gemmatimonadales bacterium]|nr:oligosaccharide flippase family protein [Gemmatimonadales bacterium]